MSARWPASLMHSPPCRQRRATPARLPGTSSARSGIPVTGWPGKGSVPGHLMQAGWTSSRWRANPDTGPATPGLLPGRLRDSGRIRPRPAEPESVDPIERVACRHERFPVDERGLQATTVRRHLPIVRAFPAERFGMRAVDLASLTVGDCNGFILRNSRSSCRRTSGLSVTALRGFLRHLHQGGGIPGDPANGILPVMNRRRPELPKSPAPDEVGTLLDGCDRTTVAGRRDHAILLLPGRPGPRAGEIVRMTPDDPDWRRARPCRPRAACSLACVPRSSRSAGPRSKTSDGSSATDTRRPPGSAQDATWSRSVARLPPGPGVHHDRS